VTTGYLSSVVKEIKEHMASFVLCPAAQVYWWLRCRGCITDDINQLIRHCFTLSQQQKVTKSKYVKDVGHAIIDQTNSDNIINAATTQGIYNLTLGLSDKERRKLVAGKAYETSVIIFGKAKEGSMEAHNFLSTTSITSTHTRNEKKWDASSVATAKSLAKSVFSIETSISKVTEDDMEESKDDDSKDESKKASKEQVTFKGMEMLCRGDSKAMTLTQGRRTHTWQGVNPRMTNPANWRKMSSKIQKMT
jgi:hypothetical protein